MFSVKQLNRIESGHGGKQAQLSVIDAYGSACDDVMLQSIVVPRTLDDGGWSRTTEHGVAVSSKGVTMSVTDADAWNGGPMDWSDSRFGLE